VIELPEQARPKPVSRAAEAVRGRENDLAAARAALVEASRAIDQAVAEDRERYATERDAGRPDPGREAESAARAEHAEAQRRVGGEEVRLQRAEAEPRAAIDSSLDAWIGQLTKTTEEAELAALALVDAFRDGSGHVCASHCTGRAASRRSSSSRRSATQGRPPRRY
jgi:hypothetical protein